MGRRNNRARVSQTSRPPKYWYRIFGFVAVSTGGLLFGIYYAVEIGGFGNGLFPGGMLGMVLAMMAAGIAFFPDVLHDSVQLRESGRRWRPKWWYYTGIPVALGVAVAALMWSVFGMAAWVFGLYTLGLSTYISMFYYIYCRHKRVGVP